MDTQAWWVEHQHQAVGLSQLFHNDSSAVQAWLQKTPEVFLPQLLDDGFCIDHLQQMLPLVEEKAIANHVDIEPPYAAFYLHLNLITSNDDLLDLVSERLNHDYAAIFLGFVTWLRNQEKAQKNVAQDLLSMWKKRFSELHGPDLLEVELQRLEGQYARDQAMMALRNAVKEGNARESQELIAQHDLSIHEKDFEGCNILMHAVLSGSLEMVQTILGHCPQLSDQNDQGDHALMLAIRAHHVDIASLLLELGCDLEHQNLDEETPLTLSIKTQNLKLVDKVLDHGAYISMGQHHELDLANEFEQDAIRSSLLLHLLKQSAALSDHSHYEDNLITSLLEHRDELEDLVKSDALSSLSHDSRQLLYKHLLHPYHAMGAIFWHGHEQGKPPAIIHWLENQLIKQVWSRAA